MSDAPQIRNLFIRRPIFSAVISIVIVLLGLFSLSRLAVESYPPLTPPEIQVQAVYPGATAQDVADAVAAPIEQQLSGMEGLLYFKSANSSDGVMNLSVYFDVSRNPDLAAVDVQNQIALAEPQLPQEVVRNGITVRKRQTAFLVVLALSSDDPRYDTEYLNNYAKIYIDDELKRLPGVGDASTFGQLDFSMLLSLDPDRMAQLGLTVSDVAAAVQEQNATNPAGRIGREPAPPGTQLTIPVITSGRLKEASDFEHIIVRGRPDGSLVHLSDIGEAHLGARNYDLAGRFDGAPTALTPVFLRPGANALQVKREVVNRMTELAKSFPQGVRWSIAFDTTPYVTASINEVVKTLFEALLLVTLVVFVFLQSWRATLIPVVAVPVSVIGAFFGMQVLGFSVNLLTLFGLVLAIGIVVDDAIVVIENVERIMAQDRVPPAVAADRAMRQVSRALISIVLVLCSVFVPVAFLGGITGLMYKQFAITIAVSVVLSGIVALTLTPALCAVLLRLRMSRPASATMFRTAGSWRRNPSTRCTTASVRCSEDASGSWIATAKYPLSSVGMKDTGTCRHSRTVSTMTTANAARPARGRRSTRSTFRTYVLRPRSNRRLKTPNGPRVCDSVASLRSKAHSAGVSVSATIPDSTTETAMVIANCLYMRPVMPPKNATGTNTEHSTSTMAISARLTWRMARSAATAGGTRSWAMIRSTFSMTTIASSTTIPIASTSANKVSTLIESPRALRPRNVPMTLTGTASIGISVARQLCRNTKTTSATRSSASSRVITTSRIEALTNGVVSKGTLAVTPRGKFFDSSATRRATASRARSALAPVRRYSSASAVGRPLSRPTKS